jgi:hypothetical protein
MNHIDKIRTEIIKGFDEKTFSKEDQETSISPSGKFRLDATNFWSKDPNCDFTKVEVYKQPNEKLFEFFVNDSQFFYGWLNANSVEYLVCAEDIFGGQTIVDLTNHTMRGYSPNEDGFIWTDFHLSPNGQILATIGCYWACSAVIKLFDFSEPMVLPLREIRELELLDNDEIILGWVDNETLRTKGIERKREPEYFANGSQRWKILSETQVERIINIYQK